MDPLTLSSSVGVIGESKLNIWKIFRNVGEEGQNILKLAKLSHAADHTYGLVVTTNDETYSFFRAQKDQDSTDPTKCKI